MADEELSRKETGMKLELTPLDVHLLTVAMSQLAEQPIADDADASEYRQQLAARMAYFNGRITDTGAEHVVLQPVEK